MVKIKLKGGKSEDEAPAAGSAPMLTTKIMEPPPPGQDMRKITFSRGKTEAGEGSAAAARDAEAPETGSEREMPAKSSGMAGTVFAILGWLLSLGFGAGIFIFKDTTEKNMRALKVRRESELNRLAGEQAATEREYAVSLAQFEEKKRLNEEAKVNLATELESLKKRQEGMQSEAASQKTVAEGLQQELSSKTAELRGVESELVAVKREVMVLRTKKQECEKEYKAQYGKLRADLMEILKRGQIPEMTAFSKSYFKSPLGPAAMYFLAEKVYQTSQIPLDALPYYNNFLRIYPDSPYTNFAKTRIDEIQKRQPFTPNPYLRVLSHKTLPLVE